MFRSKKDVDRHVQDIFRKMKHDNEKPYRCYNIAKLYYQVGDYESAKRYVSSYLEVREESPGAHKLLGQTLEALGEKEAAFNQYKLSLELDASQNDLVLKVCELLVDMDTGTDVNRIRYWVKRADKQFPHHPIIFKLKEKMLMAERPNDSSEDLEALIASELSIRPTDVDLRVKLIKYYMAKQRFNDAYNHAANVETTYCHRNSIMWYQSLSELLGKCKKSKQDDWSFWVFYISTLERYAALSLKEHGNETIKTIQEATQAVFNFDQVLTEFKSQNLSDYPTYTEEMLTHMWGQLHFHLACLLLRKTKREQGSWDEASQLCAVLFLFALHVHPVDSTASWAIHGKDQFKNLVSVWYREGSYRCSQAGNVLQDCARNNVKKLMNKINTFFFTEAWREKIYRKSFASKLYQQHIKPSYFCNHTVFNPPLRLCLPNELKRYDEVSEEVWPDSLHHHVWLGIRSRLQNTQKKDQTYPQQYSHVFPELQFSVHNLNQAGPDTLCKLDIDAFLNAAVLCAAVIVEDQQQRGFLTQERLPTLPADLTSSLCTSAQEKWWSYAYKMYSRKETLEGDLGEIRQELRRGLEVVRCIGNHGLHPVVLVHLARLFHHRVKILKEKDPEHLNIRPLEVRYELYWSTVIPLLERLQNNQTIRVTNSKLFNYEGKNMSNAELTNALEEGKLLLAQRFLRSKQYEEAIDALQVLKCPEATFQQGQIYKILADEIVDSMPRESLTSEIRSQHIIMLSKARNCYYLTLDRLRNPGMNLEHPLDSELCIHISAIENELKRIDLDLSQGDLSRNECDVLSDESYSPAHSGVDHPITNPISSLTGLGTPVNILSTPQKNTHRTPKQSSTPCRPQHQDIMDLSRNRTEARPSPERLDAQIRQMMHTRDTVMQTIIEQNKIIMEKIDELTKEMAELRKDSQKQRVQPVNFNSNIEDDLYVFGEEDYGDINYTTNQSAPTSSISGNIFPPSHRHPYSPLVYPPATAFQGYYQGTIPFTDPNAQAIPPLYPPNVYPIPVLYPNRPKVPDMLQQGLFAASRLATQLSDLIPPTNISLQMPMQKVEVTKPQTIVKDTATKKSPPVNVVITTSDTLPTTVPLVQPTLSVTIPAQYRMGNTSTVTTTTESQNVPHCYQISMPPQATIPTTINLSPLPATLTSTPANISLSEIPKSNNIEVRTASSLNSSAELHEPEHDPIPDFVPVIPLPAEVKVTTGEEDEVTLYCARAKLFRFVDKEWKERGVGNVKLLRNAEGKVRLLMRREQVLKICANHMLRPDMELTSMPNNDKAWIWVANDFADEEVKIEKLCIRFKTAEEALSFKQHFDSARANLTSINEKVLNETDNKAVANVKISEGENNYSSSLVTSTVINNVPLDKEKTPTSTAVVGGFSFTSKPIIQTVSTGIESTSQKQNETPKVSPFVGFSFNKPVFNKTPEVIITSTTSKNVSTPITTMQGTGFTFSIGMRDVTTVTTSQTAAIVSTTSASRVPLRRLHAPALATLIATTTASGITQKSELSGQEACETKVLFEQKATLQRQYKDNKNWENKGTGQMKIILNVKTGNLNLLMHREEDSKVCYNQDVSAEMKFNIKSISKNVINWVVYDTKGENKLESYSVTFKSLEQASKFYDILINDQQKKKKDNISSDVKKYENKKISETSNVIAENKQVPLSELFKPPPESWECNACYTRNDGKQSKCLACGESSPFATSSVPTGAVESTPSSQQVPLSQLFKKPSGSWECKACYISNLETYNYCIACDSPKDPSMPPKQKTSGFGLSSESKPTFTFGIPQESIKDTSGFTFRINKSVDGATDESASKVQLNTAIKSSPIIGIFGGMQQQSTSTSQDTQFTFGCPEKSFGFNFTAKSPAKSPVKSPAKSPGAAETSDEEVVESDDIHFSPIIPMPDEIEVKTGEEDEEILYSHRAKLFRYDSVAKEWKERGLGDIKLLRHHQTKKLRLIMRRDQVLKLCLNHCLLPEVEFKPKDEKTWLWNAADYSEGAIEYMQFACRFKTSEIAADFKKAIDNARKSEKLSSNNEIVQDEQIQQQNTKSSQDIQIIYELKVTPEERDAALKLQLPENFYAYKQKEDCPGCIGCKESSITPPIEDSQAQGELRTNGTSSSTILTSKIYTAPVNTNSHINEIKTSDNGNGKAQTNASTRISFVTKSDNSDAKSAVTVKPNTSTTSNIFGFSTLSVEDKSTPFNDKKSAGFLFGASVPSQPTLNDNLITSGSIDQSNKSTEDSNNALSKWFGNSNVKICEPVGANQQSSSFPTSVGNLFNKPQFIPSKSLVMPNFGSRLEISTTSKPIDTGLVESFLNTTGSSSSLTFTNTFSNLSTTTNTTTPSSTTIFGMTTNTISTGNAFRTGFGTMGAISLVGNTSAPFSSNLNFGPADSTLPEDTSNKDDNIGDFLTPSNLTFSSLAQKGPQLEAFKKDPNFSFTGTGSSVFGSKITSSVPNKSTTTEEIKQNQRDKDKKDDNDEDECNENENDQEHDPHFEPIIPMPDAIEVRTGEEDEEKIFCNRAKLYRYNNATKEWKERGVGEMKILHHAKYGSYRLLLRREQVYKVVCNFLINPDTEFRPLSTSDRAWIWAGMNHAEETPCVEELAVKFKTSELAAQFKEIVEKVQQTLRERQSEQDIKYNRGIVQEDQECVDDIDDEIDDQEDVDDDDDDHDEDEGSLFFEKRATLYTKSNDGTKWIQIALGTLAIYYDSNIFGEKIIFKADGSGEMLSNTIISMTTEIQLEGKKCIWTAIDHALEPPTSRTLKAIFSSPQAAEQMHKIYICGLECAKQADISEQVEEK